MNISKNIDAIFTVVIGILNIIIKFLDFIGAINLMSFSIPLVFIWSIMIVFFSIPLQKGIETIGNSININNLIRMIIISLIISLTSYLFIIMGFAHSYLLGLSFSIFCIGFYSYLGFYYMRKDIYKVFKNDFGKIAVITSIFICLFLPSILTLIDPAIKEPKIILSSSKPEIYIKNPGDSEKIQIIVKNVRGYAWNFKLKSISSELIYVYIDGILNGEKIIDYIPFRHKEDFPLEIKTSYTATNGIYSLQLVYEYTNARGIRNMSNESLPIYLGELPPPPPLRPPWIWIALVVIVIIEILYLLWRRLL